jgi:hypothetical protein
MLLDLTNAPRTNTKYHIVPKRGFPYLRLIKVTDPFFPISETFTSDIRPNVTEARKHGLSRIAVPTVYKVGSCEYVKICHSNKPF